jgi:uncharacterized protein with ParB-like and HNH nuclease domain
MMPTVVDIMKASETTLRELLEGTKQFQVPLFQRRYSWNKTYWLTLWEDLINIYDGEVEGGYFIGTIVTQSTPGTAHGISPFIVIDGQQRLTTITLLLAVVRNLFKLGEDENSADEINQLYLVNKFKKDDDFYKFLPTQRDRGIYKDIIDPVNNHENTINRADEESSNIMQAFNFFTKQVNTAIKNQEVELEKLKHVILDRLILVSITSDDRDNPYLIFESLNNKGLDLTQSDLIRNYVFMQFPQSEREKIYKDSWLSLEQKFKDNSQGSGKELDGLTQFFWFYLRKNGNSIAEKEIYKQMRCGFDDSNNKHHKLDELIRFSGYYERLRFYEKEPNVKLRKYFQGFLRLDFKTCNVFLLNIFELYDRSQISMDEFQEILCLLESYFIRRLFTGTSTMALSKIFDNLYGDLLSKDTGNITHRLRVTLKGYTGNKIFPANEEFKAAVISQKIYKPAKIDRVKFILERLEEHIVSKTKEEVSVNSSGLTIEHIMPQSLSPEWKKGLGDEYNTIHDRWVHTLANLTLTADNPALSNKIFAEKKKLYEESKLNLNKYFDSLDTWNADTIEERANELADMAIEIWPMP